MIGNKVCFFQRLDSTNSFMKNHLSEMRDGDMICARVQTAGRGRRDNIWISVDGNLHFSFVVLNQKLEITPFDLTLKVTVALLNMLERYGIHSTIKYPNDILVHGSKISGILIEHIIGEDDIYIVGVGVNVISDSFDQLDYPATSIYKEIDKEIDYRDVLFEFIKAYNLLDDSSKDDLMQIYLKRSIVLGRKIIIDSKEYICHTVTEDGELVLNDQGRKVVKGMNDITLKEFYNEQ